jgi:hypothetical protein
MKSLLSTLALVATVPACGTEPSNAPLQAEHLASVTEGLGTPFPAGSPIKRSLIGQNDWLEPLPDTIWPFVGASGVKIVRIGGNRQNTTPLSNSELLDQVNQILDIGAHPLIQVSDRQSATEAAAMVTWINVDNAKEVKLWTIGNEPDKAFADNEQHLVAPAVWNTYTSIAPAMRDVDSTIKIVGPGMAWYSRAKYEDLLGGAWDISGVDGQGRFLIDHVNFHRYPFGSDDPTYTYSRAEVLDEAHNVFPVLVDDLVDLIQDANDLHGRADDDALGWALTEFNVTWKNLPSNTATDVGVCSFLNGQFFAEYFKVGMEKGANTMATWSVREGGGNCSSGDLGFLGGTSDTDPVERSSYYHMKMVADYLLTNEHGLLVSSSTQSLMRPIATSRANGQKLAVMILNEDTVVHSYALSMDGGTTTGAGDTQISVAADHPNAYADSMPGESTVVLVFDDTAALRKKVTYALTDLQNGDPPLVQNF